MTKSKENRVQISFRVDEPVKRDFDSKLGKQGRDATEVLGLFVQAYINDDSRAMSIVSGKEMPRGPVPTQKPSPEALTPDEKRMFVDAIIKALDDPDKAKEILQHFSGTEAHSKKTVKKK